MRAAVMASMALAATLGVAGAAQATCSNQTIRGNYTFTVLGSGLSPAGGVTQLVNGVGVIAFDGAGSLVQEDFVVVNGVQSPGGPPNPSGFHTGESGTYSINPDCTGSVEIVLGPGNTRNLAIVVAGGGATIHSVVASGAISGNPLLLQTRSDFERIPLRDKSRED